jgi:hypothetical protein
MTQSLIHLIEDKFVKFMYEKRLEDVARLANIWHQDSDKAKEFEEALDVLLSTHLSLRLRFPVLLPPELPEVLQTATGPVNGTIFHLDEAGEVALISSMPREHNTSASQSTCESL